MTDTGHKNMKCLKNAHHLNKIYSRFQNGYCNQAKFNTVYGLRSAGIIIFAALSFFLIPPELYLLIREQ